MKVYAARADRAEAAGWEALLALLDSKRRDKVHRIKNEAERNRSIYAGLLLRYAFLEAGYTKQEWQNIQIAEKEHGKPYFTGYDDFCYSLSHSGDWVLCATDAEPVGADIQQLRPYRIALAKRFYHEKEYQYLKEMTQEADQCSHFYKMWAAKESYAKLTGRGIGGGISNYITDKNYKWITDIMTGKTAFMRIYEAVPDHIISVCSFKDDIPKQLQVVPELDKRVL